MSEGKNMTKNPKRYAIIIVILVCVGIFVPNFAQYQVSSFGSQIMRDMDLDTSKFAQIATAPLIPGIFLSLVVGILVDKFGVRKPLIVAMALSAAGIVWRAYATGYTALYVSMICMGVGATFLSANTAKIFGSWFPPKKVALTVGLFLAASNGAISLGTGSASMFPSVDFAFKFSAVLAIVVLVLHILFVRDRKTEKPDGRPDRPREKPSVIEGVKVAAKNKYVWIAALCLMLDLSAYCSLSQFLPQALASRGIPEGTASLVAMSLTLGGLTSCFVTPYLFMKIGRTKLLVCICGIISALGIFFAWRISDSAVVLFILIFITGFFGTAITPTLSSLPVRLKGVGVKYAGTAGGLICTIQLAGTVIIPSYIVSPITGSNYVLMFGIFAGLDILLCIAAQFLPKEER